MRIIKDKLVRTVEVLVATQGGVKPARPFIVAIQSLVLMVPHSDHDCFKYRAAERATPGSVADAEQSANS